MLRHHGCLAERGAGKTWQKFEHEAPNDLWQMDWATSPRISSGAIP
ncbi:hypothetical protein KYC_20184 [Achromobacter arsenitoxydans SY8]|uniref:Uncharacterized protein n=1 Tax=Achromobacter arsenitoxydans SY8 TaxID=477184 RepID=H0FB80_9BURK|nr:hypothetical protein KYC_20184 [Achromobacter arsenitoxydans SY8]